MRAARVAVVIGAIIAFISTTMAAPVIPRSINPIFKGPEAPFSGVLPPFLNDTSPRAPLRPTGSVASADLVPSATTTPIITTTFIRYTHITTSTSTSTSTPTSVVEQTSTTPSQTQTPTNTPTPTNTNIPPTTEQPFIPTPLLAGLISAAILIPLITIIFSIWAILHHRKCEAKKKTQNRRLTPPPVYTSPTTGTFNPYFVDLELGSTFGWGRLSGVSDFLTEEAQERRGGGRTRQAATDDDGGGVIAVPEPVARVGRASRFVEEF